MICRQPNDRTKLFEVTAASKDPFGSTSSILSPSCDRRRNLYKFLQSFALAAWWLTVSLTALADSDLEVNHSLPGDYMVKVEASSHPATAALHQLPQHHYWTKMFN